MLRMMMSRGRKMRMLRDDDVEEEDGDVEVEDVGEED